MIYRNFIFIRIFVYQIIFWLGENVVGLPRNLEYPTAQHPDTTPNQTPGIENCCGFKFIRLPRTPTPTRHGTSHRELVIFSRSRFGYSGLIYKWS